MEPKRGGGEQMVCVMNRLHIVYELDCWKLHKMWSNRDLDLAEADYTKMRAADVPPSYHRWRDCAPCVG